MTAALVAIALLQQREREAAARRQAEQDQAQSRETRRGTLDFTSRERHHINQRGWLYVVALPVKLWDASAASKLAGRHVWIDGELHRVRGVFSGQSMAPGSFTVGLLVSDR